MVTASCRGYGSGVVMGESAAQQNGNDFYHAVADSYRQSSKTVGKDFFVFDGDRHLIEPLEAFTKYLDKDFQDQAPYVAVDNGGGIRFVVEGRMYQKPHGWGVGRPEGNSDYRPRGVSLTRDEAVQHALDKRDEDMDITGVDIGMWIPTGGLFLPDVVDIDLQYALMRALNDWTAKDYCVGKRHLWCGAIPLEPGRAVAEVKRCKELGASAMWLRPNVMQDVRWWTEDWDPVWEAMTDNNMALLFHEATGTYNATHSADYKYDVYWMAHVASHPLEMCGALIAIIGYGVLQRHPRLNVMMCEAGVTWVPYFIGRMDEHVESRPAHELNLDMLPSDYFKRQVCICAFEDDEPLLAETMALWEGRNMGYTSDYPHWDSSGISGVERYLNEFPDISPEHRELFFSRNLIDVFNLKPDD